MVEDAANVPAVEDFVMALVPEATLLIEPLGSVRQYRLPRDSDGARMSGLLRELDANWARLGISDWAVTNVSLEEVFLKVTSTTRRVGEVAKTTSAPRSSAVEERKDAVVVAPGAGAGASAGASAAAARPGSPTIHVSPASSPSPAPSAAAAASGEAEAPADTGAASASAPAASARDQLQDSAGLIDNAHPTSAV